MARLATTHDLFNALAEPGRRRIVELLGQGDRQVNQIVMAMRMAQPSVSKHLRVLCEVGLVGFESRGRERIYALRPEALRPMHAWVSQFEALWDSQLDRIKRSAERKQKEKDDVSHRDE